jgi:hypothetical protein
MEAAPIALCDEEALQALSIAILNVSNFEQAGA